MNTPKYTIKSITKLLVILSWKDKHGQHSDLDLSMDFVSKNGVRAMPKIYFGNETSMCATYYGDNKGSDRNKDGYAQEMIAINLELMTKNVENIFVSVINNDKEQVISDLDDVIIQLLDANSNELVFELNLKENEITGSASAAIPFSFDFEAGSISVSECPFAAVNTYNEDIHAQYFKNMAI